MITVRIPATTANLGPGFDCLGLALTLHNRVELRPASHWSISIEGEGAEQLERGPGNLVWRAACRLWDELGVAAPEGVALHLSNHIPLGRGLGSSAAAIVAGLVVANAWAGSRMSQERLLELATEMEGHPDNVAPALYGGFVATVGAEKGVFNVSLPLRADIRFGACIPELILPTAIARQALPETVPHRDAVFNVGRVALMLAALTQNRPELLSAACQDRLHQPYRAALIPGFEQVCQAALAAGASAVTISGAGPTILTMMGSQADAEAIATAMCEAFSRSHISSRFMVLELDMTGAQIEMTYR